MDQKGIKNFNVACFLGLSAFPCYFLLLYLLSPVKTQRCVLIIMNVVLKVCGRYSVFGTICRPFTKYPNVSTLALMDICASSRKKTKIRRKSHYKRRIKSYKTMLLETRLCLIVKRISCTRKAFDQLQKEYKWCGRLLQ